MTIKKSLISVSAAALLVAGMTGCSSSSSSSSTTNNGATATTIKVVDGYVIDANVTTWEKNATTGGADKLVEVLTHAGNGVYTATKTTYDFIRSVPKTTGTFIMGGTAHTDYNATTDVNISGNAAYTMYAPNAKAGAEQALTPISTMIYNAIKDANKTAYDAGIDGNYTKMAEVLGISAADLKSQDPQTKAGDAGLYASINTMVSKLMATTTSGTDMMARPAATTYSAIMDNLIAVATKNANDDANNAVVLSLAAAKKMGLEEISGTLLDKAMSTNETTFTKLDGGKGLYTINDQIEIDDEAPSAINGQKGKGNANVITFALSKDKDFNASATSINVLAEAEFAGRYVNDTDTNKTKVSAIIKNVPLDNNGKLSVNAKTSEYNSTVASTMVAWSATSDEGNVFTGENNMSSLGITDQTAAFAITGGVATLNLKELLGKIAIKVDSDQNLTGKTNNFERALGTSGIVGAGGTAATGDNQLLYNVKVGVDSNVEGSTIDAKASNDDDDFLALGTVTTANGSGFAIVDQLVDYRDTQLTGRANKKPEIDYATAGTTAAANIANSVVRTSGTTTLAATNNLATAKLALDINSTGTDSNVTITNIFDKATLDTDIERTLKTVVSTSATAGNGPSFVTVQSDTNSTLGRKVDTGTGGNTIYNVKVAGKVADYSSIINKYPEQNLTISMYDEFGYKGADKNVTFVLNRALTPNATSTTGSPYFLKGGALDINNTSDMTEGMAGSVDGNVSKAYNAAHTPILTLNGDVSDATASTGWLKVENGSTNNVEVSLTSSTSVTITGMQFTDMDHNYTIDTLANKAAGKVWIESIDGSAGGPTEWGAYGTDIDPAAADGSIVVNTDVTDTCSFKVTPVLGDSSSTGTQTLSFVLDTVTGTCTGDVADHITIVTGIADHATGDEATYTIQVQVEATP